MTRKDYVAIAQIIADTVDESDVLTGKLKEAQVIALETVAVRFADAAFLENNRFDHARFYRACKLPHLA